MSLVFQILVHWIMSVMKVRFVAQLVPVSVTLATGALEDGVAVSQPVTLLSSAAHIMISKLFYDYT